MSLMLSTALKPAGASKPVPVHARTKSSQDTSVSSPTPSPSYIDLSRISSPSSLGLERSASKLSRSQQRKNAGACNVPSRTTSPQTQRGFQVDVKYPTARRSSLGQADGIRSPGLLKRTLQQYEGCVQQTLQVFNRCLLCSSVVDICRPARACNAICAVRTCSRASREACAAVGRPSAVAVRAHAFSFSSSACGCFHCCCAHVTGGQL